MNGKVVIIVALILFFVIPSLFLGVVISTLTPLYNKSSNLLQMNIGQSPLSPQALGIASLELNFTKKDTSDTWYTIVPEATAYCNQTVNVTYAFYNEEFNKYDITTMNMQGNRSTIEFGGPGFKATYFTWSSAPNMSLHLVTYDPYSFPFDVYETPNIIIAFDTTGSNSTNEFILNGWTLNSEVPAGFSATVSDYKELSKNETDSALSNDSGLGNSLALEFRITMLRDKESLLWLSIYVTVPFLGIWAVFAVSQIHFDDLQRMQIFAGTLLAIFVYLLAIRGFTPPTLTRIEVSVIELVGIWAFLELLRSFCLVWRKNRTAFNMFEPVGRLTSAFKPIVLTVATVITVSVLVYINSFIFPSLYNVAVASGQTPWGIFTSLFVHTSFDDLALNMIGILVFSALFAATNLLLQKQEKRERSIYMLAGAFLMAMLSNAFWVWLIPTIGTTGASGIVFALQGSVLGFALLNSLGLRNIRGEQDLGRRIQLAGFYLFNLVVFVAFFLQIDLAPKIFLNVGTAVNVVVHGIAFLGNFMLAILWHPVRTVFFDVWTGLLRLRSWFRKSWKTH